MLSRLLLARTARKMVNNLSKSLASTVSSQASPQEGQMMSRQKELQRLPVPPLQETLRRYVESVKPLLTVEELRDTEKAVEDFINGDGEKLHKILESKAASTENWLADWWLEGSYLKFRMPVVIYSNPAMILPQQKFKTKEDQLKHAAMLIAGALDFKTLVDRQLLQPEMMGTHPLDMSQYQKIFSTCRVPHPVCDKLESHLLDKDPPRHVLVIYSNKFFKLNVYDAQGKPYDEHRILPQLVKVVDLARNIGSGVGVLTTEHRDVWAEAFKRLLESPRNAQSIDAIKKAIIVVCLDQRLKVKEPFKVTSAHQMLLGGRSGENAANRWCDKTVQLIVGEEGQTGLLYEHSPSEGPPVAVLVDHCHKYIEKKGKFHPSKVPTEDIPEELEFELGPESLRDIEKAQSSLQRLRNEMDLLIYKFQGYGKDFIKSCKLSPDSFVQMAMQLAFYKIHKVPGATYESASTRKFLHGRTETIRSTSSESLAFCQTFESSSAGIAEKEASLRRAVQNHKDYTNLAINGLGVDRLLFGLRMIAIENGIEVPTLFTDRAFKVSTHFRISSSQVATNCDAVMIYGPLVPDGYGCCYNPQPRSITFGLSSFNSCTDTSAAQFSDALKESLTQMHDCLVLGQKSKL